MFGITGGADYVVTVTPSQPNAPIATMAADYYTVISGDTLSRIAARNGITVSQIRSLNPQITNPNAIRVGQQIRLR
jgi:peptidoglycan endopeptidase LytE